MYLSSRTSPVTAMAEPPFCLISFTTCSAFSAGCEYNFRRWCSSCCYGKLTSIYIRDNHLGSLIGEEPCSLSTNALSRASDDSNLVDS